MAERVQANPALLKQRKELIEHIFGTMKRSMDQGYFLLRTRKKVAAEMSLTVLAYNLKRVIKILGVTGLIAGMMKGLTSLGRSKWWLFRERRCAIGSAGRHAASLRQFTSRLFTQSGIAADRFAREIGAILKAFPARSRHLNATPFGVRAT